MSVFKRKSVTGTTETELYHYRFFYKKKIYYGVCEGCRTKPAAVDFEKNKRKECGAIRETRKIKDLVELQHKLITGGKTILLPDTYKAFMDKPRNRKTGDKFQGQKKTYWKDFQEFIEKEYPDIKELSQIEPTHAEKYISYIRKYGRFNKKVSGAGGTYTRKGTLSTKTLNIILQTLREVFDRLLDNAGMVENPFKEIEKLDNEPVSRETFTEKELRLIFKNADDFIRPLFSIGICTALREGDICLLRWEDVDFDLKYIRRKMMKTKKYVEIPMIPPLRKYMLELKAKAAEDAGFVLPEHAEMYQNNPSGISSRIKSFLISIGIQTTREVEGRTRLASVKDFHSTRHAFCFLAGIYSIPLLIVQSIAGHMTPEMTSLYQLHASLEAKAKALGHMPNFLSITDGKSAVETKRSKALREKLDRLLEGATGEQIKKVIKFVRKNIVTVHGYET